ncbi:LamG domain-containing protein [Candidatus Poribacteria bacterium]|nr:LamG domain-containing protein [Candidatus Poribacteria bacterium]
MNLKVSKFQCLSLFALTALCLWQWQAVAIAKVPDGAMLILTFDKADLKIEGGKPVQALDTSGNNNHGLINGKGGKSVGGVPPEIVDGKYGNALRFAGNNWVEVVDSKTLRITDALTMAAWVNPASVAGEQTISTKDRGYYLQLRNGRIGNYAYNLSAPGYHESPDAVPLNQWSHIAMSWDGNELVQYLNGKKVSSVKTKGQIATTDDSIGIGAEVRIPSRGAPEWRFYTGIVDEVLVFNIGKTGAEINEIMAGAYLAVEAPGKLAITWGSLKQMTR